jgi:hypothetical protein|tara:strand:+ start:448 stop:921 length:474 start_codon:yes stop_codon:yes gene_type:complete
MINEKEIEELFKFADKDERFGVALRGALSQIRLRMYLESLGLDVKENPSDNAGAPDFIVNGKTLEHKRARNENYADGSFKAEFQKSRGKVPQRLYDDNFSDLVSVDVSHHTGKQNDFLFTRIKHLKNHFAYNNKISSMQRLDEHWTSDIKLLLENEE